MAAKQMRGKSQNGEKHVRSFIGAEKRVRGLTPMCGMGHVTHPPKFFTHAN